MDRMSKLGSGEPFIIGMVHCLPLPGSPRYGGDMAAVLGQAVADAKTLQEAGMDAVIVENMGDDPYAEKLEIAQSVALAAAAALVRQSIDLPVGIDAAMNDYESAIAIALAVGGDFVRAPVFVDTVQYCGCGIIEPSARRLMSYRKALGAEHIKVLADVQVKHTTMALPHISVEHSAQSAADCGADGLIVTGSRVGTETPLEMIQRVKRTVSLPVLAGSGVKTSNIARQMQVADGAIVGSSLKQDGVAGNPVSLQLARDLIEALRDGAPAEVTRP